MTTYLIVYADSNLRRAAWQALLVSQPGVAVEGAIGSLKQIADIQLPQPGVVLVDAPSERPELVSRLKHTLPDYGILFLDEGYDLDQIVGLLREGVTGFLTHDSSVSDLARAIIAAGRGEMVLPEGLATKVLLALARGEMNQDGPPENLTDREQEVLTHLALGHTNKDIAQSLFLSVRTVEAHLHNIYGKLGVTSRTEAALWAVKNGTSPTDKAR